MTADGRAKLLDFGIAALLDDPAEGEESPRALTPQYASPEQLRGEAVTTTSDVFSLGVLLYQLLSGRLPFPGDTIEVRRASCEGRSVPLADWFQRVSADPPPGWTRDSAAHARRTSVEQLRRMLDGELEAIVQKALQPDPALRYRSARELADDLRRHAESRPVSAVPQTWTYTASRFVARNRTLSITGAVAILALFVSTVLSARFALRASAATRSEQSQRQIASSERREAERLTADLREQRREVEQVQRVAEQRLADLERFASQTIFELHAAVSPLEGSWEAQQKILELGLASLDTVRAEARDRPEVVRTLVAAYAKLATTYERSPRPAAESMDARVECADRAVTLGAELLRVDADDLANRRAAGRALATRAQILEEVGRSAEAADDLEEALRVFGELDHPGVAQGDLYARGAILAALARSDLGLGGSRRFDEFIDEALEIQIDAARRFPSLRHLHWDEVRQLHLMRAQMALLRDEPEDALSAVLEACDAQEELEDELATAVANRNRAECSLIEAMCLLDLGRASAAQRVLEETLSAAPLHPGSDGALPARPMVEVDVLRETEGPEVALTAARSHLLEVRSLAAAAPHRPIWHHVEAELLVRIVRLQLQTGDVEDAAVTSQALQGALDAWCERHRNHPGQRTLRHRATMAACEIRVGVASAEERTETLTRELDTLRQLEAELQTTAGQRAEDARLLDRARSLRTGFEAELADAEQ